LVTLTAIQKERGELGKQSELLDQMMADHEKQDAHETNVAQIKNAKTSKPSKPGASADTTVRLRAGAKRAQPQAAID
jgi:hypothetical protein